jgi:hypothetical protein
VHGTDGVEGAVRAVEGIASGLGWAKAAKTVAVLGQPTKSDLEQCWELGATLAAGLMS